MDREYTAVAYVTRTGRVLYDIDLADAPTWDTQLNDGGTWQIKVPLGNRDGATREVREWCVLGFCSVAILLGDTVCQAGPITAYAPAEDDSTITVSGKGIWEAFNMRVLHNKDWNSVVSRITDASANLTFTDSLWNIARSLAFHALNWSARGGSGLPVDLPAADPAGGTDTRSYFGYDLVTTGQRLQELTQDDNGPDIYFQPYLTVGGGSRAIRHSMLIGQPDIVQAGVPLLFDYNSNLTKLSITADIKNLATTAWAKGAGSQDGLLYGYATATPLILAGYPAIDRIDSDHSSATSQPALNGWATAAINLYGNQQVEQWKATVKTDMDPQWGEYIPGQYANYEVHDHPWVPDGRYLFRLIGVSYSSSNQRGTVDHLVQAVRS